MMGRIASLASGLKTKPTPISLEIAHFIHIVSGIAKRIIDKIELVLKTFSGKVIYVITSSKFKIIVSS